MINEFKALNGHLRCVESMKVVGDVVNVTLTNGKVFAVSCDSNGTFYAVDVRTTEIGTHKTVSELVNALSELNGQPVKEFDDSNELYEWSMSDNGVTSLDFTEISYGNFNDMTGQLFTLTAKTNLGIITLDSNSTYIEDLGYDEDEDRYIELDDSDIISYFNSWLGK